MNTQLHIDFDKEFVAGGTRNAMAAAGATKRDLWMPKIDSIRVIDDFNVRDHNAAYVLHIRNLANSMKVEGFYIDKPLAGYVMKEDGQDIIYITDGHCRLAAAKLAISEGAAIERLPVVICSQGTSKEDLTVALIRSNTGKQLTPFETGVVCKRLSRFGWDSYQIAERLNFVVPYVDDLLLLVGSPMNVRQMVQNEQVSASNAIAAIKAHGEKAFDVLRDALERAQSSGSTKVTAKHLGGGMFKKQIKKTAPKMFEAIMEVKSDPAYSQVSESVREKIEALIVMLEEAKAKDATKPEDAAKPEEAE